jgi:CTP synthase (UTP-ammonia lyase)
VPASTSVQPSPPRIAIVGDYGPEHETHRATGPAIDHAAAALDATVEWAWVPTPDVAGQAAEVLDDADGVWIATGSPYVSMAGALDAITFARTTGRALLGTCAGFQHLVLEVGRNRCGIVDAATAESDPDAPNLMIEALACSLAGQTFSVRFDPGSIAARAYRTDVAEERYYCSFGLNPDFVAPLAEAGLVVTGTDQDGEPRVIELRDHPFAVGTLFVPQVRSTPEHPHPLVLAFVEATVSLP